MRNVQAATVYRYKVRGNWNSGNTGMGTCKNCYSSDSSPVRSTELYKSSHSHHCSLVLSIAQYLIKKVPTQCSISTDVICDKL